MAEQLTAEQQHSSHENAFVGVVTTLREDGSPHTTVVWVDVGDDGVSFNTARGNAKDEHLQADPRVSLMVVDPGNAWHWVCRRRHRDAHRRRCRRADRRARQEVPRQGQLSLPQSRRDPPHREARDQRTSTRTGFDEAELPGVRLEVGHHWLSALRGAHRVHRRQVLRHGRPRRAGVARAEDVARRRAEVELEPVPLAARVERLAQDRQVRVLRRAARRRAASRSRPRRASPRPARCRRGSSGPRRRSAGSRRRCRDRRGRPRSGSRSRTAGRCRRRRRSSSRRRRPSGRRRRGTA